MLEKIFKLKENNTTARTEIIAGLTTFMTMAYIIALNPNLLTGFGKDTMPELWNGVFLATCIASAIGTIVMAFLANKPFAMAPGSTLDTSLCQNNNGKQTYEHGNNRQHHCRISGSHIGLSQ